MKDRRNIPVEKDKIIKLCLSKVKYRFKEINALATKYEMIIPVIFFLPEFSLSL
jgi:hypothetical protein